MNINDRAKKIVEDRREGQKINNCIHKILDVFEASNDMEVKVWEVLLYTGKKETNKRCFVDFLESDQQPYYYNSDDLVVVYNRLGITQNLMTSMKELDKLLTEELILKVYEYWINHPLDCFEISNNESSAIRIKMIENAICKKKDTAE